MVARRRLPRRRSRVAGGPGPGGAAAAPGGGGWGGCAAARAWADAWIDRARIVLRARVRLARDSDDRGTGPPGGGRGRQRTPLQRTQLHRRATAAEPASATSAGRAGTGDRRAVPARGRGVRRGWRLLRHLRD